MSTNTSLTGLARTSVLITTAQLNFLVSHNFFVHEHVKFRKFVITSNGMFPLDTIMTCIAILRVNIGTKLILVPVYVNYTISIAACRSVSRYTPKRVDIGESIKGFLLSLNVCHVCVIEGKHEKDSKYFSKCI